MHSVRFTELIITIIIGTIIFFEFGTSNNKLIYNKGTVMYFIPELFMTILEM